MSYILKLKSETAMHRVQKCCISLNYHAYITISLKRNAPWKVAFPIFRRV